METIHYPVISNLNPERCNQFIKDVSLDSVPRESDAGYQWLCFLGLYSGWTLPKAWV